MSRNEWQFQRLDFGLFGFDVDLRPASAISRFVFPRHRILACRRHGYLQCCRFRRLSERLARTVDPLRHLFITRCPHRTRCERVRPYSQTAKFFLEDQKFLYRLTDEKQLFVSLNVDDSVLSNLITHGTGLTILSLCYCAHSIASGGVYLDAEEPGAKAAALPHYYVRYFLLVIYLYHFIV